MTVHPWVEELVIASLDAPLTLHQQDSLQEHLGECRHCTSLAAAYRADANRLRSIAFQQPPERVRAAILARGARSRPLRARWILIASVLALLAALLGTTLGSGLRRPTLTVAPLGQIEWLTPDDARRLVAAASVDGGWLLATADEASTATTIRVWRPDSGWTTDGAVDQFASDPGALIGAGIQSPSLSAFVANPSDQAILYTRDRAGGWQRFELAETGAISDVATLDEDAWVLAETTALPGSGAGRLAVLPSRARFAPIVVPSDVRGHQIARLAVTRERIVVAGCATREPAACDLVIYAWRRDGQGWTNASLPREVDLRTPVKASLPTLGEPSMLPPQVVALDNGFLTIVPTASGGTEIWGSPDGVDWQVEGTFDSSPYPAFLGGDGMRAVAIGGSADDMWLWIPTERREWVAQHVDLGAARPGGVVVAGDRLFAVGIDETTVAGWQLDVRP